MEYVVILILMLAAFSIVLWPLLSSAQRLRAELPAGNPVDELLGRRDSAYQAIKELDFEYQLGNLSRDDYQELRDRYRATAAGILKELEQTMGGSEANPAQGGAGPAAGPAASLPCHSCQRPTERSDEYCWSCGTRLEGRCPSCSRTVDRGDVFCGYCGSRLEGSA